MTPRAALLTLLLAACGPIGPGGGTDAGVDAGTDAGSDAGRCSNTLQCTGTGDCFSPYCSSGWTSCTATSCPAGQHCEQYQVDKCGTFSISDAACRPDCPAVACPVGRVCGADGGCVDAPCSGNADCPTLFACQSSVCRPKACSADGDCPGGFCVNNQCAARLGYCSDI